MKPHLIRDSRGKPSWTWTLVLPMTVIITIWFVIGGVDVTVGGVHVITATKSGADYALAVGVWLALVCQRGYTEKVKMNNGGANGNHPGNPGAAGG